MAASSWGKSKQRPLACREMTPYAAFRSSTLALPEKSVATQKPLMWSSVSVADSWSCMTTGTFSGLAFSSSNSSSLSSSDASRSPSDASLPSLG